MATIIKINNLQIIYVLLTITFLSNHLIVGQRRDQYGNDDPNVQNNMANGGNRQPGNENLQVNSGPKNPPASPKSVPLADHPDCKEDVMRLCPNAGGGNMRVLQCMQNVPGTDIISPKCQNVLWLYKQKLTKDLSFEGAGKELCHEALAQLPECAELGSGKGLVVSCLINHLGEITDQSCRSFLMKMQQIVFSDYRLIYKLAEGCDADIKRLQCGRISNNQPGDQETLPHGEVVACLMEKERELSGECRTEILRVAELQSDDFNKDRALYRACREDARRLCPNVSPGSGEVYKCLYRQKNNPELSDQCYQKLTTRQKLERVDYRVNKGLQVSCKDDIIQSQCLNAKGEAGDAHEVRLSRILLCLESRRSAGYKISPECLAEVTEVRRSLMSDYQLTPEIVSSCPEEVKVCSAGTGKPNGVTLHCLMDRARKRLHSNKPNNDDIMSQQCLRAVQGLLKEVNIRENIGLDPVVADACASAIQAKCRDFLNHHDGGMMDCLMQHVNKPTIPRNSMCWERLMEVQYFISRDFTLSAQFYRTCHSALTSGPCIYDNTKQISNSNQSAILLCLYRAGKKNLVTSECMMEARKVLLERAKSVDLPGDVHEACMADLASFCSEATEKNDEMDCLEDNLENLKSEACKKIVERYIEEEESDPELNEIIRDECEPAIENLCKDADRGEEHDDDDELSESLMNCLIKNKYDGQVTKKCRAQINHHQIVMMKDWHLSKEFKENCQESVKKYCSNRRTKSAVVTCLSELNRNDTLTDQPRRVDKKCRKHIKFELLQMSSSIKFDPEMEKECQEDVEKHCRNPGPEPSSVISCLRAHQKELSHRCHAVVFKRELSEVRDPRTDFLLNNKCKRMIKKYCQHDGIEKSNPAEIFTCLVKNKAEDDFDTECKKVIISRERTRAQDVRLNPLLVKACSADIVKYCSEAARMDSETSMEGKVLYCLRNRFAMQAVDSKNRQPLKTERLSDDCYGHVKRLIMESVLDYMQDRQLASACQEQIKNYCVESTIADNNNMGDNGEVIKCLQKALHDHSIPDDEPCAREVARTKMESKADVQVDPLLYRACALDIQNGCHDIPPGEGRRMSCLLKMNSDPKVRALILRAECAKALNDRLELWNLAAVREAPETFNQLANDISRSDARNYLLGVIMCVIGALFFTGCILGRVSKRVSRQAKIR